MHGLPYRSSFSGNDDDILHHFQGILKIDQINKFKISLLNKMMPTTARTATSATRGGWGSSGSLAMRRKNLPPPTFFWLKYLLKSLYVTLFVALLVICKCINKPGARLTGWCKGGRHRGNPCSECGPHSHRVLGRAVVNQKASSRLAIQLLIKKPHNRKSINVGIFLWRSGLMIEHSWCPRHLGRHRCHCHPRLLHCRHPRLQCRHQLPGRRNSSE